MFPSIIPAKFKYKIPIAKVSPLKEDVKNKQISDNPEIIATICSENKEELINESKHDNNHVLLYHGALGLLGLFAGPAFSSVVLLIPHPKYWYTYGILYAIGVGFGLSINFGLVQPLYWMDINFFRSWKPLLSRFSIVSVSLFVSHALSNIIWTIWGKLKYPMPLNYFLCNTISFWIMQGTLWLHFPKSEMKKNIGYRYKMFLLSQIVIVFAFWQYLATGLALNSIAPDYQWTLAILFAVIREINQAILSRICCRISEGNEQWIKISAWHWMSAVNAFFLTVAISSVATRITSYIILTIDFFLNMMVCVQVIWKFKKNSNRLNGEITLCLNELVLNEKLEMVIPLGYCLCYLMAYYGPNKYVFRGIAKSDPGEIMKMSCLLFLIDSSSLIVSAFLLWTLCRINMFNVYLTMQKELWLIMASQEAFLLYEVT